MQQAENTPGPGLSPAASKLLLGLFLGLLTLLVFSPLLIGSYQFITLDDPEFVSENPHVKGGLTAANVRWAFTTMHAYQWTPLTWLSLQLDTDVFGSRPGGYHLMNVLLHTAAVLMLAHVLHRMTGSIGCSLTVAAFFAIHPLRVESVAWIAERKDVLSCFLWMLTLAAYTRYAQRPGRGRYVLVLLVFSAGLLAKPMAVTLPFVLLLLDYWPLRRFRFSPDDASLSAGRPASFAPASAGRLVAEKMPLLLLSLAAIVLTVVAQQGAIMPLRDYSWGVRIGNALFSYLAYLGMMLCPINLALYYPLQSNPLPWFEVGGAAVVLVSITVAVLWEARKRPYLAVGWFWYLGTLVPVIGLVQLSSQARADRYTYIPCIGILLGVVWGMAELAQRWRRPEVMATVAALLLLGYGTLTWLQVHYWENSSILWTHTLEVTGDPNPMAHNHLGVAWLEEGRPDRAERQFLAAIREAPGYADAHYNLGLVRLRQRKPREAASCIGEALRINPNHGPSLHAMGVILASEGKLEAAQIYFDRETSLSGGRPAPQYP